MKDKIPAAVIDLSVLVRQVSETIQVLRAWGTLEKSGCLRLGLTIEERIILERLSLLTERVLKGWEAVKTPPI